MALVNVCWKFGPPPQAAPPSTTFPFASKRAQSPGLVLPLTVPNLVQTLLAVQEYRTPFRKNISPAEHVPGSEAPLRAGLVRDAPVKSTDLLCVLRSTWVWASAPLHPAISSQLTSNLWTFIHPDCRNTPPPRVSPLASKCLKGNRV